MLIFFNINKKLNLHGELFSSEIILELLLLIVVLLMVEDKFINKLFSSDKIDSSWLSLKIMEGSTSWPFFLNNYWKIKKKLFYLICITLHKLTKYMDLFLNIFYNNKLHEFFGEFFYVILI